jgi:hypothetical protein
MSERLDDLRKRIQRFEVHFCPGGGAASPEDVLEVVCILEQLLEEVERIDKAMRKAAQQGTDGFEP